MTRSSDVPGTRLGLVTTGCTSGTIRVTIGAATLELEMPDKCPVSYTKYESVVYKCEPAARLHHCTGKGYKVAWTAASGGACPSIPTSPDELKKALRSGVHCVKPKEKQGYDWSASVSKFPDGTTVQTGLEHGTIISAGNGAAGFSDTCIVWNGNPDPLLVAAEQSFYTGLLDPVMTLDPTLLPTPLREIHANHPPIPAFSRLQGTVDYDYHDGGPVESRTFSGMLTMDGRFNFQTSTVAPGPSGPATISIDMSYDGSTFFYGQVGTDYYNIYTSTSPQQVAFLCTKAAYVQPLWQWARNPFAIALSSSVTYDSSTVQLPGGLTLHQPKQVLQFTEDFDATTLARSLYYVDVDTGEPSPLAVDVVDSFGQLRDRVEYGSYQELQPGVWRPMTMVDTIYDDQEQPRLTTTITLTRATVSATLPLVVPRIIHPEQKWLVRTARRRG